MLKHQDENHCTLYPNGHLHISMDTFYMEMKCSPRLACLFVLSSGHNERKIRISGTFVETALEELLLDVVNGGAKYKKSVPVLWSVLSLFLRQDKYYVSVYV